MSAALLTQRHLGLILGTARVKRMIRAGWLQPVERKASAVLFDPRDIRAALRRLERHESLPADKAEVIRVRLSEARHGRSYVKIRPPKPTFESLVLDFSNFSAVDL